MTKRLLILCLVLATSARAQLVRETYEGARPTGMGGAFLAVSDDQNALWYNPAGLAYVKGLHWNVVDLNLGFDSLNTESRINRALFNGDTANLVRPDTEYFQGGLRTGFFMPYFALQLYDNVRGFFDTQNLATPLNATFDVQSNNDIGLAAAVAFPLGPYAAIGATVRAFQRIGTDFHATAQEMITNLGINPANLNSALFTQIQQSVGSGVGLAGDLGAMVTVPLPKDYPTLKFAAVADDIGMTSFRPLGGKAPHGVPMTIHFGSSLTYNLRKNSHFLFALDVRHAFEPLPFVKTLHVGVEYHLRPIALRLGLYEGNPSAGFSVEFPPHTRIIFTTYEPELGSTLWQRGQRWYMLQLVIGFNPL